VYAIVETGGKQFKVQEGDVIFVEKLDVAPEANVTLDKVLLVSNENTINVGAPYIDGATVSAKVLAQGKAKKIIVFKFKPKKGYKRKQGHRQLYTKLQIEKINA